ncbi:MAG: DUF2993 domain-containing protein [Limnospira sp.]
MELASEFGEQTLNQIAKVALSSQLDQAEELDVRVQTDPGKLVQGQLDSFFVNGSGLVVQSELRMESFEVRVRNLAVEPLAALGGDLQLSQIAQGTANITLAEADLNRAFDSEIFRRQLRDIEIDIDGRQMNVDLSNIRCRCLQNGKIGIDADLRFDSEDGVRPVSFLATPRIASGGRTVAFENIEYRSGADLSPALTDAMVAEAEAILDLENFEMEGIDLRLDRLDVRPGKLDLYAIAELSQLPNPN